MKLFTIGPVEMFPYTLEESSKPLPYFRTPEFSQTVLECTSLLKEFAGAEENDDVVHLTCSGTGAMEAVVINCLTKEDKALVINGGSFGNRFCQLLELHQIPHDVIKVEMGKTFDTARLSEFENRGYTAMLINADETSTAQLYPINELSKFCNRNNMIFIVDAISAFLLDDIDFKKDRIDALIVSSQKALSLAPGFSVVILSERMINERVNKIESGNMYMDFKDHLNNGKRGQTPFTPAVGTILQMRNRLRHIKKTGVKAEMQRVADIATDFRKRVNDLPEGFIHLPEYTMSNACTAIYFDKENAKEVYETLKSDYELVLTPSGGALENRILRVGHLGNHTIEDNAELIAALKEVMGIQE